MQRLSKLLKSHILPLGTVTLLSVLLPCALANANTSLKSTGKHLPSSQKPRHKEPPPQKGVTTKSKKKAKKDDKKATKTVVKKPAAKAKASGKKGKVKKAKTKKKLKVRKWLHLGPVSVAMPVFNKDKRGKHTTKKLFAHPYLNISGLHPKKGQKHVWFPSTELSWKSKNRPTKAKKKGYQLVYLATYLNIDRYAQLSLRVKTHQMLQIFLDGRLVGQKRTCTKKPKKGKKTPPAQKPEKATSKSAEKKSQQDLILQRLGRILQKQDKQLGNKKAKTKAKKKGPKAGTARAYLRLTPGKHLLVLKSMYAPKCVQSWKIKAKIYKTRKSPIPVNFKASLNPKETFTTGYLLRRKRLTYVAISPDGAHLINWITRVKPNGRRETWNELRDANDGELLDSTRALGAFYGLQWSPNSKYYSFVTRKGRKSTLWFAARNNGRVTKLFSAPSIGRHVWEPKGRFIIYSATQKVKSSKLVKMGFKRLRGMNDRWPWYRYRTYLYAVNVKSGTKIRLTAGHWGTGGPIVHPKGTHILFTQSKPDYTKRFFRNHILYQLNLKTLKSKKILQSNAWLNGISYSPDGKKLLFLGGATLFGKIGVHESLGKNQVPNAYDTQAYIYDLKTKKAQAISKNFQPSIFSGFWHPKDGNIYFRVLNKTRVQLYQYNVKTKTYKRLPTGVDSIGRVSFAWKTNRIAFVGQSVKHPRRLYTMQLDTAKVTQIHAPGKTWFKRLKLGKVKDWNFKKKNGEVREGRVYYPPNFNAKKRYPVIVYYYGGTFPITRGFGGRYPFHLWAANGYLVYVLQPSGAVGFGQYRSALHVNEWGSTVAGEIIMGTKKFLKAHPYANPKSVGCIGASYGGFMTMYVITRTKLFAAAISHAGISNLASYWGGGYWGFLYSAVATAHRYPWSHPQFYIKQSPLYSAHKVHTPLLLLHGQSDTNVPPFESYQMYTALRILKRPVELVLVRHTDHWVLRHHKRLLWTQTIIAWFDRQLKKQPLWWKTLHGKGKH